jgi:1-acyl-sn-glycerol-3-phosphate acyltransferase
MDLRMAHKLKESVKTIAYAATKVAAIAIMWPYFRLSVKGRKRVPKEGAVIFAANHFSYADPPLIGIAMPRRIRFVMADGLFRKRVLHVVSRLLDVIPVETGQPFQTAAVRKAMRLLHNGQCVGIFPEGQRSRTGELLPAQPGVGLFAKKSGAPVVPLAILGTNEAWPPGQLLPKPGKVRIVIGEPLLPAASQTAEELADKVRGAIADLMRANGYQPTMEE